MSHLDNVVYAIETQLDDSSVVFLKGNVAKAKHEQARRIVVNRSSGTVERSETTLRFKRHPVYKQFLP